MHHILLGPGMSELWTKAIHEMKMGNADVYIPSWTPMPVFDDLFSNEDVSEQQELIISRKNPHDTILILHSSGISIASCRRDKPSELFSRVFGVPQAHSSE